MDDRSRIARVKVFGTTWSGSTADEVRYNLEEEKARNTQLSSGNAGFTLDDAGSLITLEEYFPFGETSFGSFAKKRYRYNGKAPKAFGSDEESGLYYYGARYYATWTCRFISIDPLAGQMPFSSPYSYAANNPVVLVDVDGLAPGGGGGDSKSGQSASDNDSQQSGTGGSGGPVPPSGPGVHEGQHWQTTWQETRFASVGGTGGGEPPSAYKINHVVNWHWDAGTKNAGYLDARWFEKGEYRQRVGELISENTKYQEYRSPYGEEIPILPKSSELGLKDGTKGTPFYQIFNEEIDRIRSRPSNYTEALEDRSLDVMLAFELGIGLGKGALSIGTRSAKRWWASRVIGTAQNTGTRGHSLYSKFIALRYALDPRVARVTLDLGYKRLVGRSISGLKWGPRPDVGVLFRNGSLKIFEVASKTDKVAKLAFRNQDILSKEA